MNQQSTRCRKTNQQNKNKYILRDTIFDKHPRSIITQTVSISVTLSIGNGSFTLRFPAKEQTFPSGREVYRKKKNFPS